MENWKEVKEAIDCKTAKTLIDPDDEVKRLVKYSISAGGSGVPMDMQILSTWIYGLTDAGHIADWIYFINELAKNEDYSVEDLGTLVRFWFAQPSFFADYCGLTTQYSFTKAIVSVLDQVNKEELISLLDSFRCYIANINAWAYQYLPWGIGYAFPAKDLAYFEKGLAFSQKQETLI